MILVDTSVLIANAAVHEDEVLAVSVISIAELEVGIQAAGDQRLKAQRASRLAGIVENASILPIDREVARAYAALRAEVGRQPTNDLWIAATALAHDLELVTADEQQAKLPQVRARYLAL